MWAVPVGRVLPTSHLGVRTALVSLPVILRGALHSGTICGAICDPHVRLRRFCSRLVIGGLRRRSKRVCGQRVCQVHVYALVGDILRERDNDRVGTVIRRGCLRKVDVAVKAQVILFCPASSAFNRHAGLIQTLRQIGVEMWPDGLRISWIGVSMREDQAEREAVAMQTVAQRNQLGWAIGYDLGPTPEVLGAFNVNMGSVTMFVLDHRGRVAWEIIDPMHWDQGLIRYVLRRVIDQADAAAAENAETEKD